MKQQKGFSSEVNAIIIAGLKSQSARKASHIYEKVDIFNRTTLNILSNFFLHEIIVREDKDPPWFNNRIKTLIQEEKMLHVRLITIRKIILI